MPNRRRQGASDQGGLSVEVAHYFARVYGAARAGCMRDLRRAGCSEEEAEDIFSTVLEGVMSKRDPVGEGFSQAQTVALLKQACRQKLIDERRHRAVLRIVPLKDAAVQSDPTAQSSAEAAEAREAVAIGREAISSLPERDRSLFLQRHHLGLSPEEILSRNPGLSRRTYRKIMQRANARALAAIEEIGSGERCAELRDEQLHRFLADEASEADGRSIRLHLSRCGGCRREAARMREHLHELAAGLAIFVAAEGDTVTDQPGGLLDATGRWLQALSDATRGPRERLRELAIKASGLMPGSGESAVGQVAGLSAAKAASACAGAVAAGCLAAAVVPGIGAIEIASPERADGLPRSIRMADPLSPPSLPPPTPATSRAGAKRSDAGDRSARRRAGQPFDGEPPRRAERSTPQTSAAPSGRPTISGQQTGTELGAEAAGAGVPAPPYSTESGSSPPSTGGSVGSSGDSPASSGEATSRSRPEFGL